MENVEEEALIHKPFNKIIEICNEDPNNRHLTDVLSWVTQLKKLLMDLIIELKNDLPGKTSIEGWENFVDAGGVAVVVPRSALAHIVDFHMNNFKKTYQMQGVTTRSSVTSETETGKTSPLPEKISAEFVEYHFKPYQKLERYLKDYILYEKDSKVFLGFQFWKDVVDEIYDRYYQENDDKDIEIERLRQQLDDCLKKLPSDSGSGGDTDNRSNDGNDGSGRGSDGDDQGSSDKASSKSSGNMSIGSDKTGDSTFSGFASLQKGEDNKGAFDVSDLSSSLKSINSSGKGSKGYSAHKSDGKESGHDVKRRIKGKTLYIPEIDDEEEELRAILHSKIAGYSLDQLNQLNRHMSNGSRLSEEMVMKISPTSMFSQNRITSSSIDGAKDPFDPESPKKSMREEDAEEAPIDSWYGMKIIEARDSLAIEETLGVNWLKIWRAHEKYARENFGEDIFKTPDEVEDPFLGKGEEGRKLIESIITWVPGTNRKGGKKKRKKKKTRRKRKKKKKKTRTKK